MNGTHKNKKESGKDHRRRDIFFNLLFFLEVFFDGRARRRAADRFRIRASRIESRRPVDERDDRDREHSGDARPRLDCSSQSRYESRREKLHFLLARINGEPRVISFKQTATIPSSILHHADLLRKGFRFAVP